MSSIVLLLVVFLSASCAGEAPKRKSYSAPPPMKIDSSKQYTATIKTKKGDLVLWSISNEKLAAIGIRPGISH